MISEQQQEQASLYALGVLPLAERKIFEAEMGRNPELADLAHSLQSAVELLAKAVPAVPLPFDLKDRLMQRIAELPVSLPGLRFAEAASQSGWKKLPIPGASIKLLSLERERGYAVLLGKLEPGAAYPAHENTGPEDFYILTGDLFIGNRKIVAGDFHHADQGSHHGENHSVEGCTLIAVLTSTDPLVAFAAA